MLYIKDESFDPIYKTSSPEFYFRSRVMPALLLSLGFLILITQVVIPLVDFKTQNEVSVYASSSVLGVASGFSSFKFAELTDKVSTQKTLTDVPKYFRLTVEKLGIENAIVETNSLNLSPDLALGHYRGSALPGENGNTFVYGHSVLPWFYNPKNYKTIFSTLESLQTGDKINIEYNGKQLTYKVERKEILPIDLVKPLETYKPKYLNESTLTLMSCWPAGTKAKRILVRAVLI